MKNLFFVNPIYVQNIYILLSTFVNVLICNTKPCMIYGCSMPKKYYNYYVLYSYIRKRAISVPSVPLTN